MAGNGISRGTAPPVPETGSPARPARLLRSLTSILIPVGAAVLQHVLWPLVHPFSWFLAYPAVFFSSWIGGLRSGLAATGICVLIEWWFFIPPVHTFIKEARYVIPAAVFAIMGILFSLFHARLRKANRKTTKALLETRCAITEIEKGEIALRESEASLRRAQAVAHLGNWTLELPSYRLQGSEQVAQLLGLSAGEALSWDRFRDSVHPEDRGWVEETRKEGCRGEPYDIEHRILIGDEVRWVREIAQVESPASGKPIQVVGTIQDITRRRVAELQLHQIYRARSALSKCNEALIRAVDETPLLQVICEIIVRDAGYALCWVGRAEHDPEKTVTVLAQSGWQHGYLDTIRITWSDTEEGRGPTGTCIRTRQTVAVQDIAADPNMMPWREEAQRYHYRSSLAIPLLVDSQVFGALMIYAAERDAFRSEEIELLTELASDLGFGISVLRTRERQITAENALRALNAELEQRVIARTAELQQAREREGIIGYRIQRSLLLDEPPTHLPALRVAALTLPTESIDGDFFAFIEPRRGLLDIIVGDVMGKGVPAALLGAATKSHFLRTLSHVTAPSGAGGLPEPRDIVMRTHAGIVHQLIELESFVTLCYARIDPCKGHVDLVDCGHTGVIHLHGGTTHADLVHGDNLPLGVRKDEIYEQLSVPVEAGDVLILFSDGITEARNPQGELFGADRLVSEVCKHCDLQPQELIEIVRKAVTDFCGCERVGDDLTIVAVRVEEVGPPIARETITLSSSLHQLHSVRDFVRSFCGRLPNQMFDSKRIGDLELAANEVASNIIKHAYHGRNDQTIAIEAEAYPGRVAVSLFHLGEFFSPPRPCPPQFDHPRESGFGLYMLTQSADEVHYYRDDLGRNVVTLIKRANRAPVRKARSNGNRD